MRIVRLSCVRQHQRILDTKVYGTIFGMGGKNGIRGKVVMRNGKILMYAGISGALSGIGSALQQSLTTQSISALGTTNTVPSSDVFRYGAYSGADTALGKLSDYYIQRADQYHPVIEISAGSEVDIMFINGFDLEPDVKVASQSATQKVGQSINKHVNKFTDHAFLLKQIHGKRLGDQISQSLSGLNQQGGNHVAQ